MTVSYIYRKSDGLFIHSSADSNQVLDDKYASSSKDPKTPANSFEIEEYPEASLCSLIENAGWKNANSHPYYVSTNESVNCVGLTDGSVNYMRYKYDNNGGLKDIVITQVIDGVTHAITLLCWRQFTISNNSISWGDGYRYVKQDGDNLLPRYQSQSGYSVMMTNSSGTDIGTMSVYTVTRLIPAENWVVRSRKEVPFINSQIVNKDTDNVGGKVSSPSSLAVMNYIDNRLGINDEGKLLCTYAIKKGSQNSITGTFGGTVNSEYYYKCTADNEGGTIEFDTQDKSSDKLYIKGSDIEIASNLTIGNNRYIRGEKLITVVGDTTGWNALSEDFRIPIFAPCSSFSEKIDNDISCILNMMESPDIYQNYSNPITMYIDKRIETFLAEILSNASDNIWTKYY